ncbi:MAG TPA: DUF4920 domain-containing protein, partial [Petrotogaceae bacterium]|nr:DUF4920 domain-containing protein [Petrotogaceae bacterium]
MRKEWYIAQAYSGMENKVKEVIEEKAKMLGLSSLFGRVIVPEIEEIDYANRKVDRVFISNEAELYTKASKYVKKGDTLVVQFESNIKSVCKKKGCWMNMELKGDDKSFVKFKDYGFFVPLNADNSDAIVNGKAFVDVESVEELRHYAKDAGK